MDLNSKGGRVRTVPFLLGHASVEATERYLGCKQRVKNAGEA